MGCQDMISRWRNLMHDGKLKARRPFDDPSFCRPNSIFLLFILFTIQYNILCLMVCSIHWIYWTMIKRHISFHMKILHVVYSMHRVHTRTQTFIQSNIQSNQGSGQVYFLGQNFISENNKIVEYWMKWFAMD